MPQDDLLHMTEHHLSPKSVRRHVHNNTIYIPNGVHQAWHKLFQDLAPEMALCEIVENWLPAKQSELSVSIATKFWTGTAYQNPDRIFVPKDKQQAFNLIFPTQSPSEIFRLWAWQWVPSDYLIRLEVTSEGSGYIVSDAFPDTNFLAIIRYRQQCKLTAMMNDTKHV